MDFRCGEPSGRSVSSAPGFLMALTSRLALPEPRTSPWHLQRSPKHGDSSLDLDSKNLVAGQRHHPSEFSHRGHLCRLGPPQEDWPRFPPGVPSLREIASWLGTFGRADGRDRTPIQLPPSPPTHRKRRLRSEHSDCHVGQRWKASQDSIGRLERNDSNFGGCDHPVLPMTLLQTDTKLLRNELLVQQYLDPGVPTLLSLQKAVAE